MSFPRPSPTLELEPGLESPLCVWQHLREGQTINA
jgi:hypothetical protein